MLTCVIGLQKKLQEEQSPEKDPSPWQSVLKRGLGEVQPGSTPSGHTDELPSSVLPWLTQCLPWVIRGSGCDSTVPICLLTRKLVFYLSLFKPT